MRNPLVTTANAPCGNSGCGRDTSHMKSTRLGGPHALSDYMLATSFSQLSKNGYSSSAIPGSNYLSLEYCMAGGTTEAS